MLNLIIVLSVFFSALAQIFLKLGMNHFEGEFLFSSGKELIETLTKLIFNPYLIGGIFLYIFSLFIWLYVLKKVEVSYAYPFIALGFVFVLGVGAFFLNETINLHKMLGVSLIVAGIIVLSKSIH